VKSTPDTTSALELKEVSLSRGGRVVLRDASASFRRHAVTGIVGPSGAGKTSLLRCLNRLEEPDSGSIALDGVDIATLDPIELRRRVGMIFQTPALFEGGVRANLVYGLDAVTEDELAAALEAASLDRAFLDRDSSALSVGQAQRVCIARALVRKPEVLLMDEPTSALDRDASARIEELVGSLNGRGLTVVLVTHDLDQTRRVCDRAVLLVDGSITAKGSPEDVTDAWPAEQTS
jgi:ABC-type multidrug transport system fused ATPase/permease subunit